MKTRRLRLTIGVMAMIMAITVAACTTNDPVLVNESDMSRVRLYASLDEMANDSALVVLGTVIDQKVAIDIDPITPFTLHSFRVEEVIGGDERFDGNTIIVRQIGSPGHNGDTSLLRKDGVYLLYLTPSGLGGELAEQYYVTGGNAGIYATASGSATDIKTSQKTIFNQLVPHKGERLPSTISLINPVGGGDEPNRISIAP